MTSFLTSRTLRKTRRGTTTVEAAAVLPVFFLFLFGMMQVGHACMVKHLLQHACRTAARVGATEGVSTDVVKAKVLDLTAMLIDREAVTVVVKDASIYDEGGDIPESWDDLAGLPDLDDLDQAETRQLFMVQAQVAYNDVALLPLAFTKNLNLAAIAFMRHE